jgi:2-hydroxychromene-2-carboxylate isomerase
MTGAGPVLYVDVGSPYAYLAVERAPALLGAEPELHPVLLGAIFARRGWGSWSATPARSARIADLQARAARAGLPPFTWPPRWPADGLAAMRALTWADMQGSATAFARTVLRLQFARGADIADVDVLEAAAREAGLEPAGVRPAIADPAVKQRLRETTDAAWEAGVRGIPTLRLGGELHYGDDRLEAAIAAA